MTNLICLFTAFIGKLTIPGWTTPDQKLGIWDRCVSLLCYFLYANYFLDFQNWIEKMAGSGWMFTAMAVISIILFVMDAAADLSCRFIRKKMAQLISLGLRCGCCIMLLSICALHLAMRITGVAFYASQDTLLYDIVMVSAAITMVFKLPKFVAKIRKVN